MQNWQRRSKAAQAAALSLGLALAGFLVLPGLVTNMARLALKQDGSIERTIVEVKVPIEERELKARCLLVTAFLIAAVATGNPWITAFAVVTVTGMVFNFYSLDQKATYTIMTLLVAFVLYPVCQKHDLRNILCGVVVLNATYAMVQWAGFDFIFTPLPGVDASPTGGQMTFGFCGNPNVLSCLIGMSLPLFFRGNWLIAVPLLVVAMLATKSTTGVLAAAAATGVYLVLGYWNVAKAPVLALLVSLVAAVFVYAVMWDRNNVARTFNAWPRVIVWKNALKLWWEKPVLGHGIGSWERVYVTKYGGTPYKQMWVQAHNDWLQALVETGIIGALSAVAFFLSLCRKAWRKRASPELAACLVAVALCAFGFFPVHLAATGVAMLVIFAEVERAGLSCRPV